MIRRMLLRRMIDVLLADRGGKIGDAVMRSLRRHGLNVEAFDDSAVVNDYPGYIRNLKKTVLQCRPRMIFPIFKASWVSAHRNEFDALLPYSDASVLDLLDDKLSCSQLASSLGLEQPRLYADDDFDSIERWPVVFKRAAGLSGSSVYFPESRRRLDNLVRHSSRGYLVMDYINGHDVSVDLIRWPYEDGTVFRQASAYRVIWPRQKGISYVRLGIDSPEIVSRAERLLDAVDYRGVCGVDFRVDARSGKAYFLECNPRFSGGIRSSLAAGLDLPYLLWQLANGEKPQVPKLCRHRISIG